MWKDFKWKEEEASANQTKIAWIRAGFFSFLLFSFLPGPDAAYIYVRASKLCCFRWPSTQVSGANVTADVDSIKISVNRCEKIRSFPSTSGTSYRRIWEDGCRRASLGVWDHLWRGLTDHHVILDVSGRVHTGHEHKTCRMAAYWRQKTNLLIVCT